MQNPKDICYLQVNGVNQLEKEIIETKNIADKVIDLAALHRNEMTEEIEGIEIQKLKSLRKAKTTPNTDGVSKNKSFSKNLIKESARDDSKRDVASSCTKSVRTHNRSVSSTSELMLNAIKSSMFNGQTPINYKHY
jgi:hypothetical protein